MSEKIKEAKTAINNRRTLTTIGPTKGLQKENLVNKERSTRNELRKCVIRYMKCIQLLLQDEDDDRIRNIVNQPDRFGKTPLHYAVDRWPHYIVQDLLKFGADLNSVDNDGYIPLTRISPDTLMTFLDENCMRSDRYDALDDDEFYGNIDDEASDGDTDLYQQLLDDYEPKLMTNIEQSPIEFDYCAITPSGYCKGGSDSQDVSEENQIVTPEMRVLTAISKSKKHKQIVTHPVIKSFVWIKWNMVSRYYHRDLRMNILLTYFLMWYILNQFGGLEFNNMCERMKNVTSLVNQTDICRFFSTKLDETYANTSRMTPLEAISYHMDELRSHSGYCTYLDMNWLIFVPMSFGLMYFMLKDTKHLFFSKNNFANAVYKKTCTTVILPLGMDIINLSLILLVLVLSDSMLHVAITIIALFLLCKEFSQFIVRPLKYLKMVSNWNVILLIALITVVVYVPNQLLKDPIYFSLSAAVSKICPEDKVSINVSTGCTHCCKEEKATPKWQDTSDVSIKRGMSAFIIVLSTTRVLFKIAKYPGRMTERFNKYARMYRKVASSFLKILTVYSIFILSFAMGFYILFHNDIGEAKLQVDSIAPYVFFETPYEAVIKTMAMFIGEVDFNNIPIGIHYGRRDGNISGAIGYLFYLVFMFSVAIVLMNLLNGLAVTDITAIVKESEVLHQISIIEILEEFEEYALGVTKLVERTSKVCPCLKPLLLKFFDLSQEFQIFKPEKSSHAGKNTQKKVKYPSFDKDESLKPKGYMNRLIVKYFGAPKKDGWEHILSQARGKLLVLKKSQMQERSLRKKPSTQNKRRIKT